MMSRPYLFIFSPDRTHSGFSVITLLISSSWESSVVASTGNAGQTAYAAAKAGIEGFTRALAREVGGKGITVNCVAPGFITTAMTDKLNDDQKSGILGQIPAGRMGEADEIAAAVLYLSSAEAGYVTGTTLHVNGGMAML